MKSAYHPTPRRGTRLTGAGDHRTRGRAAAIRFATVAVGADPVGPLSSGAETHLAGR